MRQLIGTAIGAGGLAAALLAWMAHNGVRIDQPILLGVTLVSVVVGGAVGASAVSK